ncbi:MAG: DUF3500 domain-containing protein, partial [Candidatus Binatia bacterium]
ALKNLLARNEIRSIPQSLPRRARHLLCASAVIAAARHAALIGLVALVAAAAAGPEILAERLASSANVFLDSLTAEQRHTATFPFDDGERFDLKLIPFFLDGLRVSVLDEGQRGKLRRLLGTALSPEGLRKIESIMSLEREVARLEGESWVRWPLRFFREPRRYHVSVFGEPSGDRPWGFRFDGHHVSLNVTSAPATVPSSTPLFLGAQPRQVPPDWEREGLRVLAREEDIARSLYVALEPELRKRATIPFRSGRRLFLGEGRRVELEGSPAGVAREDMPERIRIKLDNLLWVYLENVTAEMATARRAEIDSAGRDAIHFAWAGSAVVGEPSYYRIQGPTFLIEFDNTLDGADHVHAIWRDFRGDFGDDLLARHYALSHAHDGR